MPSPLSVGDKVEVIVYSQAQEQYAANVYSYRVSSTGGPATTDLSALNLIAPLLRGVYVEVLPAAGTFWGVRLQIISPTRRPSQFNISQRGIGVLAGDILPTQTTGLIQSRTNVVGRSKRGRAYIPFPTEGVSDAAGLPTAAYLTKLGDVAAMVYTPFTLNGAGGATVTLTPTVHSRKLASWEDITGFTRSDYWATLRKRAGRSRSDSPPG